MDFRAFYIQAAEAAAAAAAAVHAADDDDDVLPELTPDAKAVMLKLEVQSTVHAASRQGSGVAPVGAGNAEDGKGGRDLTCPECGKTFLSDKAMYGHLRSHPERGYKGATRPATSIPAAAVTGDKKPKKVPRKEAGLSVMNMATAAAAAGEKRPREEPELSTKLPMKAKRGRAPSTPSGGSAPAAAMQSSCCSEEEEAAMILLEMASGRSTSEPQQTTQPVHAPDAVSEHQMPDVEQPMLLDHVAGNQMVEVLQPIRPDHVACAVIGHQMPEAEQVVVRPEHVPEVMATESQTREVKELTTLELATEAVLVVVPANKKAKKRRLLDLEQTPAVAPAEAGDVKPAARRIPSPASDKKHECPTCGKSFPTYQALGGHMSSYTKGSKQSSARHGDLAAAQAMHNILAHNSQSGNVGVGGAGAGAGAGQERQDVQAPSPAPTTAQSTVPHVCLECQLTFPSGQALGGHKRKHWLPEKQEARAARPAAAPRDFDLNELPKEGEGEGEGEGQGENSQP